MLTSKSSRHIGLLALATAMAATRFGACSGALVPPDASWAVFFIAGFYYAEEWRWALPALLIEAILIDLAAIHFYGLSDYCLTPAYAFIVPAYSMLWCGGAWLKRGYQGAVGDLRRLALSLLVAVSACYALTEGSFYWLGSRIAPVSFAGWGANFLTWYGYFMLVTAGYVALTALGHVALTRRVSAPAHPEVP